MDNEEEEVPVHLFMSPSHSESSNSSSNNPNRRRRKKLIRNQQNSVSKDDLLESWGDDGQQSSRHDTEGSVESSPTIQPIVPPRFVKKNNKVTDVGIRPHSRITTRTTDDDDVRVDDEEKPSGRSISAMSDYSTYRDRLRDRFNTVRERAVESLSRPQSRLQRILQRPSKFTPFLDIDQLKREERDIALALDRHSRRFSESRRPSFPVLQSHQFFHEPSPNREVRPSTLEMQVFANVEEEQEGEGKKSASEIIGSRVANDDWAASPVVWAAPVIGPKKDVTHILFYISSTPVKPEMKVESGLNLRSIEDDGLFIGKKLKIPRIMEIHLEQRFLKTPDGRKWFGPDGKLKCSSNELYHKVTLRVLESLTIFKYPSSVPRYLFPAISEHIVLDIELISIQFRHHPLFSIEHVLVERFMNTWVKYKRRKRLDCCERLFARLNALRRARDNASSDQAIIYETEIRTIREKWFVEGQIDREIERKIISQWNEIKSLREQQGFHNTFIKLNIKEIPVQNYEEAEKIWMENLQIEVDEIVRELEEKIKNENDDFENDEKSLPQLIEIREELANKFQKSFRHPSKNELEFSLSQILITDFTNNNHLEEARRDALKRHELQIILYYNGKEVCRSRGQSLSQNFQAVISQRFAVRLLEMPKNLMIKVLETSQHRGKIIWSSDIYLPFPEPMVTLDGTESEKVEFGCDTCISYPHSGVGSGVDIPLYPNESICLYTSGSVNYRLGWAKDENDQILAPPLSYYNNLKRKTRLKNSYINLKSNFGQITDWAEKSNLDPNDPLNVNLFYSLMKSIDDDTPRSSQLDFIFDQFQFCSETLDLSEINPRLRLLKLRAQGEPEFQGMLAIPLNEKLIHKDIFNAYDKRISKDAVDANMKSDPIDAHRLAGKKFLDQVRLEIYSKFRQASQQKKLQDVVIEEQIPDLGTLGLTLMKWLRPKRPLRPVRKERKKVTVQNLSGQEVNIVVNVVRAFEVPARKELAPSNSAFELINVRPFVEATFRGASVRTASASGSNPTWNQNLIIPVHAHDFSPGTMQSIRDSLYLHLFDEVIVDLVEDEELKETNIHQRLERHWLGSLEIPFSTLYFNSKVEGTFKLYTPPILLAYEREAHRDTRILVSPSETAATHQKDATYLTVFITVHPPLVPPSPIQDTSWLSSSGEGGETAELEKHVCGWQAEFERQFPSRVANVKPLVADIKGRYICVTRFIRPLAPPPSNITENDSVEPEDEEIKAARFVALIPSIPGTTFFPGLFDIWLTAEVELLKNTTDQLFINQMLEYLWGDAEDHAVLLCCFFLSLRLTAYVALGTGIPHGPSAYVIVVKSETNASKQTVLKENVTVWDACTGYRYSVHDSFCPLQRVHCLLNHSNIWANVQPDESVQRTRFDVARRADWLAAFGRNLAVPADSVQPEALNYKQTSRDMVTGLQERMEARLRDNIMKWRKRKRTTWNRFCASAMRKTLPHLEFHTINSVATTSQQNASPNHNLIYNEHLKNIIASHKVYGFPLNISYTDFHGISEAVRATGVHRVENDDVEFALAVYIHPYPNNVLSVWVYLAHLIRRI